MDHYSFNLKGEGFVFARAHDVNVSYKDLSAVCDAVRYLKVGSALAVLDEVISKKHAIPYRRHNKHMGSRHELGGIKGGYPVKAANEVRKVIVNAAANAWNTGRPSEDMIVVGASANKTRIERRYPSKGSLAWGRGMYGMSAMNHSDIEYAKIEIVLADELSDSLTKNMKYFIKKKGAFEKRKTAVPAAQKGKAKPKAQSTTAQTAAIPAPKKEGKPAAAAAPAKKEEKKPAATQTAKEAAPEQKQDQQSETK